MARNILHVDLDAFFVSVEQARDPALRGRPVIVGGAPGGRGVVATASYEARALGVHSAMPLRTAQRLAPHAVFLRGDFREYSRVSGAFHAILDEFTPLLEPGGLDEAYLDVTGCEAIGGTPRRTAETIRARIRAELGLPASVGIAASKLVAKVASDRAKPDGICEVKEGEEASFLAPLPLRALPMLGPSLEAKLQQLGVRTLGQLAAIPEAVLEGSFGSHGRLIAKRARGIDPTPVGSRSGAKSISREGTFAEDVTDIEHLEAVLRGFSESVGAQLRRQEKRARTITLKLRYRDFSTLSRNQTLATPVSSDNAIFAAARGLLEALRGRDSKPVRLIGVGVSNLVGQEKQLALGAQPQDEDERLSGLFDSVRRKYGSRSLQTGRTAFQRET